MIKRFLASILALCICFTNMTIITPTTVYADTAFQKYELISEVTQPDKNAKRISTAKELDEIRNDMNGSYVLENDIDLSGYDNWTPIGVTKGRAFRGKFDGQGHKITGLKVSYQYDAGALTNVYYAVGLFGVCLGAEIKNLVLAGEGVSVSSESGYHYEGTNIDSEYSLFAGGIAGYAQDNTVISNCCTDITISPSASGENDAPVYAGGIAGSIVNSDISYCYNIGRIEAGRTVNAEPVYAGGLIGKAGIGTRVKQSYNTGSIKAEGTGKAYVGGLAGTSEDIFLENGFNEGEVYAKTGGLFGGEDAYAGGITGYLDGSIQNTYNSGVVTAYEDDPWGIGSGKSYAGGISGSCSNTAKLRNSASLQKEIAAKAGGNRINQFRIAHQGNKSSNLTINEMAAGSNNDADITVSGAEMKYPDHYKEKLGWDFDDVWEMSERRDFPVLRKVKQQEMEDLDDKCGEYADWRIDGDTLVISGRGEMYDWNRAEDTPWYSMHTVIKKIVIEDAITSIGNHAFSFCTSVEKVSLGKSLLIIGKNAFCGCTDLTEIKIPKKVSVIGNYAFFSIPFIQITFPGKAPKIDALSFWETKAHIYFYSDHDGWDQTAGKDYGGEIEWTDLYMAEQNVISTSSVKIDYLGDQELPGTPSSNASFYAKELFQWAVIYGYEDILDLAQCEKIINKFMPTVVYAEGNEILTEDQYKTWEIMRDLIMINSMKISLDKWENRYLKDVDVIDLTAAQKKMAEIIQEYTNYCESTKRNPIANAIYNIYSLELVKTSLKETWKITKKYFTEDFEDLLKTGDYHALLDNIYSFKMDWDEEGVSSIIGSLEGAAEDIKEDIKDKLVKNVIKKEVKNLMSAIISKNPTLKELQNLSKSIKDYTDTFKNYTFLAAYAPCIIFEAQLLKSGKVLLDTISDVKCAQYFMIEYYLLHNQPDAFVYAVGDEGDVIDEISWMQAVLDGHIKMDDFLDQLMEVWYKTGSQSMTEEKRIKMAGLASSAAALQNMTVSAMQKKIVEYWAGEIQKEIGLSDIQQIQYTLKAEDSFTVLDSGGNKIGYYVPENGFKLTDVKNREFNKRENLQSEKDILVVVDQEKGTVTLATHHTDYKIVVDAQAAMVYINVITKQKTNYSAIYLSTEVDTVFSVKTGAIMAVSAEGANVIPDAVYNFTYNPEEGDKKVPISNIKLAFSTVNLDSSKKLQLIASIEPEEATERELIWTSDNESIAVVDHDGIVTAVSEGTAVITVSNVDGTVKASCVVTVKKVDTDDKPSDVDNSGGASAGDNGGVSDQKPGGGSSAGGASSGGSSAGTSSGGSSTDGAAGGDLSGSNTSENIADNSDSNPSGDKKPDDSIQIRLLYYIIEFNANAGSKLSRKTMTLLNDDNIGILPKVQRENYIFNGWYTQKSGGIKVNSSSVLNVSTTLFAQWTKADKPPKIKKMSVKSKRAGQLAVSYQKIEGAEGYEVVFSTNKKFSFSSTKKIDTVSAGTTLKNLKSGKKYYVKVHAYKVDSSGKKIYGVYSKARSMKIK